MTQKPKLSIGLIGSGFMGKAHVFGFATAQKVFDLPMQIELHTVADINDEAAARAAHEFGFRNETSDWRTMLANPEIDVIDITAPNALHKEMALEAIAAGKHVYCEKPLAHEVAETRAMVEAAAKSGVVTQMGNQGASGDGIRLAQEMIDAGLIGEVYKVDCWTNRPVWPQGFKRYTESQPIPETFDWNLWLGPAQVRPYNEGYHPFKWRGFWDFGTGAMGDMGCHIMETPFKTLDLKFPYEAEASCTTVWVDDFVEADYPAACPPSSVVRLRFKTEKHGDIALNWYDGGIMPDLPAELGDGEMPGDNAGGSIFYGSDGIMVTNTYSRNPRLLPAERMADFTPPTQTIKRVTSGHAGEWVDAIINGGTTKGSVVYSANLLDGLFYNPRKCPIVYTSVSKFD